MLYKGRKKIVPIINKGINIDNQDKTITTNGVFTYDSDYTGLGIVTVNVPEKQLQPESITIEENGTTVLTPSGFDGYNEVEIITDIPLQDKTYQISEADLSNVTITITPDTGNVAMTSVTLDLSEIVRLLQGI